MLGTRVIESEVRNVDGSLGSGGQLALSLLSCLTDALNCTLIGGNVNSGLALELTGHEVLQLHVEVLTTESSVTVGGLDLENSTRDLENGDVESTTTEIVHSDDLAVGLVHAEGKGSRSRLVNDALNLEVGNLAGILSCLSLRVVEVGRHSDDSLLDGVADVALGCLLHLGEDEGTNLGGRVGLATGLNPGIAIAGTDDLVRKVLHVSLGLSIVESTSDKTLGSVESVLGVLDCLSLGNITDVTGAIFSEGNNGGSGTGTLGVLDNLWVSRLEHGDT